MYLKNKLLYIALLVAIFLCSNSTIAQSFSYVYIQGDKETPFYVKLEDQMQPRYGKDYSIISELSAGLIHIQVLFQQNMYPPQKFTIKVPENSYRGFILTRKGNRFLLYDIEQHFYLPSGNSEQDDHMPTIVPTVKTILAEKNANADHNRPIIAHTTTPKDNGQPHFIDNLELDNQKTVQSTNDNTVATNSDLSNNLSAINKAGIINSDCPKPVSNEAFDEVYKKMLKKSNKNRLHFLVNQLDKCYTTNQVRILTKGLNNDPERYEFLKRAYSRVTDQQNFSQLENLLSTNEWKGYFRLIMPK